MDLEQSVITKRPRAFCNGACIEWQSEAAKWEDIYDEIYEILFDEIKRDSYGEEALIETVKRVLAKSKQ